MTAAMRFLFAFTYNETTFGVVGELLARFNRAALVLPGNQNPRLVAATISAQIVHFPHASELCWQLMQWASTVSTVETRPVKRSPAAH